MFTGVSLKGLSGCGGMRWATEGTGDVLPPNRAGGPDSSHSNDAPESSRSYRYKAFISYTHHADGEFAPSLQSTLEQIGKPWNRKRALDVFRDDTDLSVSPELWPTIEAGMYSSEY